jgi:Short C-terminal domain
MTSPKPIEDAMALFEQLLIEPLANAASSEFEFPSMQFVLYASRAQKYELLTAEQLWYRSADNPATHRQQNPIKRSFVPLLTVVLAMTLLPGCAWQVGGDKKVTTMQPTTGQQLVDLQKAKDSGAITDSEYQAQKAKLLGSK